MPTALSARRGAVDLVVADRAALLATTPAPTCQVNVTEVHYDFDTASAGRIITQIKASGVAWGMNKVNVTVSAPGLSPALAHQANVSASNGWTRSFNVPSPGIQVGTPVQLQAAAVGSTTCSATASLALLLGEPSILVLPDPASCRAGFEPGRNRFVAGYADRLVRSRFFVPLICSYFNPPMIHQIWMARAMSKVGLTRRQAYKVVAAFVATLRSAGNKLMRQMQPMSATDGMPKKLMAAVNHATGQFATGLRAVLRRKEGAAVTRRIGRTQQQAVTQGSVAGGLELNAVGPKAAGQVEHAANPYSGFQATLGNVDGLSVGVADGHEKYALSGWLGILYYDRVRFRPSGLVAGDQVYSLALAPGEEVTITQRSETKRSRSFEEVVDRTEEAELEFSSTWSTDVSQQNTTAETSTVGGNLGVSVGIPIEGVEIGINAGVSSQDSNTISSGLQRARTFQTTARFAAKAREQHKTTFKVSTDLTEEFGSKRVLRNPNPSRALTLNFYKLYQKHRVLLERYDAKLAVGFCLDDPGKELRREIEEEFEKLDPKVPPGACPEVPQGSSVSQSQLMVNLNATDYGGDEWARGIFSTVLPANTVLSAWDFQIVDWVVDDGSGNLYNADPAEFILYGGSWGFSDPATEMPEVGASGAFSTRIFVLLPEAWGPGWWTVNVTGRMTWTYVPSAAITAEVQQCFGLEMKKIRDSFSADRVNQILGEVKAGRLELVYQRLFKTVLLRDYYSIGTNPPCELLERVRNFFDWNEAVIQYLPWWMTPTGQDRREQLRQLLLALPGDTGSDALIDDMLIASAASVYLPIRPGQERDALAFLLRVTTLDGNPLGLCVDDFTVWRDQNLGWVTYPLPTYDQVMAIGPAAATPASDPDWLFDWERPRKKFMVLDEWSELMPTDGVHVEPGLSTCGSVDEYRASALRSDLASAQALRGVEDGRALLEESLAAKPTPATTVVLGDPLLRTP